MTKTICFSKYYAKHLLDIIFNKDYEKDCYECKRIVKRLRNFLEEKKEAL